jgi:hypothetical protein
MLAYPFLFILLLPLHNRDKNEINHQKKRQQNQQSRHRTPNGYSF